MRKNRDYKKGAAFRDARLFIIACEGEKREKEYFEQLGKGSRRLKVKVLEPTESKSSPKWVLSRLVYFLDEGSVNIDEGDQVWLVMDIDKWKIEELYDISASCKDNGWNIALSNPCFEIWLLYHICDAEQLESKTCQDYKRDLNKLVKGGYNLEKFIKLIPGAIQRSQSKLDDINNPIPKFKTSRVHNLVLELMSMF